MSDAVNQLSSNQKTGNQLITFKSMDQSSIKYQLITYSIKQLRDENYLLGGRAPLSLSFDAGWLKVNKGFTEELTAWMTEVLAGHNDVFFLTEIQVLAQSQRDM